MEKNTNTMKVQALIDRGYLFVANHSGGKDSQAMYLYLKNIIPADQLIVIHSHLPEVEWDGTIEHIESTITSPLYVVQAKKTFFDMVHSRKMFPSPKNRQCTSDLKRNPIEKQLRAILKERGLFKVVNCMGLRSQESPGRAKKRTFKFNRGNSLAGRKWYDWLPIKEWSTREVFQSIKDAGQKPHWVYAAGMSRKSCCFCIMSSKADLKTAARLNPSLLVKYDEAERLYGHTVMMPTKKEGKKFLTDIING